MIWRNISVAKPIQAEQYVNRVHLYRMHHTMAHLVCEANATGLSF